MNEASDDKAAVRTASSATLTPVTMLIGAPIADADGGKLGTIVDVMVAAGAGQIVYAAVSVGGIVGIGERLFAVPWGRFVIDPLGGAVAVDFDADLLAGRDGFNKDAWPALPDSHLLAL